MSALDEQVAGNHYTACKIQPAEYCTANGLGYCESLAIRYISRAKRKNGREDIEKAIHCLELLLELEYTQADIGGNNTISDIPQFRSHLEVGYHPK